MAGKVAIDDQLPMRHQLCCSPISLALGSSASMTMNFGPTRRSMDCRQSIACRRLRWRFLDFVFTATAGADGNSARRPGTSVLQADLASHPKFRSGVDLDKIQCASGFDEEGPAPTIRPGCASTFTSARSNSATDLAW